MRWRAVATIFRKEVVETVRDRRTLFAMIVLPVILQPLLMLSLGQVVATEQAARDRVKPKIAVWGVLPEQVQRTLGEKLKATFVEHLDVAPKDAAEAARTELSKDQADLVIVAPKDAPTLFAGDGSANLDLYYDSVRERSSAAYDRALDVLTDLRNAALDTRLERHGLPKHFDKPLLFSHHDLASKEKRGGDFAGRVLPMLLLIMVLLGAIYPAIDITAGEKERGTLQTLLCAPVQPIEIVAGKYLVVVLVALTSTAVNLVAMGFAISRQIAAVDAKVMQFSLGPKIFMAIFAAMIPAALLLAALLLGLSVFARSFREAQTYITPIVTALMLPGVVAMMPSVKLNATTAFIPVVNLALLVRDLLKGDAPAAMYLAVTAASMAYAVMAIFFAARVFESEQVLLGGEKPWRDVFGRREVARVTPTPGTAVLFVAVLLVIVYYGSLFADPSRVGFIGSIVALQLGLLLLPAVLTTKLVGARMKETFSLRLPTPRALAGALLLAAGAWSLGTLVTALEAALFPGAQGYFEELAHTLGSGTQQLPLGLAVLLLAFLPAVSEEACFRGVVMSGLANTGSRAVAIIGSAVGFGVLHLSPYHIIPAAALGLALGFATLESGCLLVGGLVHFVNNSLAVSTERVPALKTMLESNVAVGLGVLLSIAGLLLLRGSRRQEEIRPDVATLAFDAPRSE